MFKLDMFNNDYKTNNTTYESFVLLCLYALRMGGNQSIWRKPTYQSK